MFVCRKEITVFSIQTTLIPLENIASIAPVVAIAQHDWFDTPDSMSDCDPS